MEGIIGLALKFLGAYYSFKGKEGSIRRYLLKKEIKRSANCQVIDKKNIKVAAIQVEAILLKSPPNYCEYMYGKVKVAVDRGAQLIVFPENNGLQLLGMIPGIGAIARSVNGSEQKGPDGNHRQEMPEPGEGLTVGTIMGVIGPTIEKIYKETFSQLAGSFGVYIMGGSIIAPGADGFLYNTAYLFGPDGEIIGKQDKLHLMPVEAQWGVRCGCEINVYETKLGKIAFPVCMDATYFETFRIVERLGADIVLIPIANPEEYNYWLALRGIWARVQESVVYGIKSALVGELLGQKFTGKSGIFCPLDISEGLDGVIAEAQSYDKAEVVIGEIDLQKIRQFRMESEKMGDLNLALYKKYLPRIYEASYLG